MSKRPRAAPVPTETARNAQKWWVLAGVGIASFLGCIDFTIVNTALPALRADLHATVTQLQWLINIFLLALSAFMVVMGRVADLYGRRRVLFAGAVGFGLASLGAGLATHIEGLIAFRLAQGVACAVLYTATGAIVSHAFPADERGRAIGWLFGINGLGLALGPVAGGVIVSALRWRWIFLINVPLIAVSLLICALSVRESRDEGAQAALDWAGLALLIVGLSAGLLAISQGNSWGWTSVWTLASSGVALVVLGVFYRVERHVPSPILKFQLFANRDFVVAALAQAALAFFYVLAFFLMPLYLSAILDLHGYQVGLMLLPTTATVALMSPLAGRLTDRFGARPVLLFGYACFALSAMLQSRFSVDGAWTLVMAGFVLMGVGWAFVLGPATVAALSSVPESMGAVAMGSSWTLHNIGGAVGLALGLLCYQVAAESRMADDLVALAISTGPWVGGVVNDPEGALALLSQHAGALEPARAVAVFQQSFLAGYRAAMELLAGVSSLVLVALMAVSLAGRRRER